MQCKFCNAELADEAVFCSSCGKFLDKQPFDAMPAKDPGKTLGIVALILGIASIVVNLFCGCCCSPLAIIGLILAIVGMVLASKGIKSSLNAGFENNSLANIGRILSIIGLVLAILIIVAYVLYYVIYIIIYGASFGLGMMDIFSDLDLY